MGIGYAAYAILFGCKGTLKIEIWNLKVEKLYKKLKIESWKFSAKGIYIRNGQKLLVK